MKIQNRTVLLSLFTALFVTGLAGCGKSDTTPGEKLDNALDKTGEKIEEAGEAIKTK